MCMYDTAMAGQEKVLASFVVQVKGVRLYEVPRGGCVVGRLVRFWRDPRNPYDPNCVEVFQSSGLKLGHVSCNTARCMSQLLQGPYPRYRVSKLGTV